MIGAQLAAKVGLDRPDLTRSHAFEAPGLLEFEDELFFAFRVCHVLSNRQWRGFQGDFYQETGAPSRSFLPEFESEVPPLVSDIVPRCVRVPQVFLQKHGRRDCC